MKNITIGLEQTDEESLAFEVSDERARDRGGLSEREGELHPRCLLRPVRLSGLNRH